MGGDSFRHGDLSDDRSAVEAKVGEGSLALSFTDDPMDPIEYYPGYETDPEQVAALEDELEATLLWLGHHSHSTRECLRQDIRLERDFPGQFVAYIDNWQTSDEGASFLVREVIAATPTDLELYDKLAGMSATVRRRIRMKFIQDPDTLLEYRSSVARASH